MKDRLLIEKMKKQEVDIVNMSNDILTSTRWLCDKEQGMLHLAEIYKKNGSQIKEKQAERMMGYPVYDGHYEHAEMKEQRYPKPNDGLPEPIYDFSHLPPLRMKLGGTKQRRVLKMSD